jgi:Helix-turn-helix domain
VIALTVDQAAQRVRRDPKTIRRWIREKRLDAIWEPITGQKYVWEEDLLQAERLARLGQRSARFTSAHQPERLAS